MKKIKKIKKVASILLAFTLTLCIASCGKGNDDASDMGAGSAPQTTARTEEVGAKIAVLKGPTGMGMAQLMDEYSEIYDITLASSPTDVTASIIKGEYDIAAVPTNLAAVLYKKTQKAYSVAAVNTLGVLYVLENGNTINSVGDLRGKTIYATGQGSTPEYILDYILTENGIDPDKDVTIEYKAEHTELTTLLASDKAAIGVLPEPNVTTAMSKNEKLRIALDLTAEWKKVSPESDIMQGCIIVKNEYAKNNPEAFEAFLTRYEASVNYVNNDANGAKLIAKAEIVPSEAIAAKALPNCNIVFLRGEAISYRLNAFLNVLYTAEPSSVGGEMPDEGFIYKK